MAPSPPFNPLLRLPGEVRNIIVEYALTTASHTLHYNASPKHLKPIFSDPSSANREFNQLKYTCKQLYQETRGLEIKYNALRFELPEDDAYTLANIQNSVDSGLGTHTYDNVSLTKFPPFLYQCSPAKLAWLRTIIITIRKPANYSLSQQTVNHLLRLALFTRENPRISLTYEYIDEGCEYKAPKYQYALPWVSVLVCLGLAMPVPEVVEGLWGWCGRGNLLFWGMFFGAWEVVGMK